MRSRICIALAVLLCLSPATASAWPRHGHRKHVHRVHVHRRVTTIYVGPVVQTVRVRRAPLVVVRIARDPAMVEASRDAHAAHQLLKSALPIYEGHREVAIALCGLAGKRSRRA